MATCTMITFRSKAWKIEKVDLGQLQGNTTVITLDEAVLLNAKYPDGVILNPEINEPVLFKKMTDYQNEIKAKSSESARVYGQAVFMEASKASEIYQKASSLTNLQNRFTFDVKDNLVVITDHGRQYDISSAYTRNKSGNPTIVTTADQCGKDLGDYLVDAKMQGNSFTWQGLTLTDHVDIGRENELAKRACDTYVHLHTHGSPAEVGPSL